MKIWAKTEEFSEGKYLVVRRDGTIPPWPHFVIGGYDPAAAAGLRAYAAEARRLGMDPAFCDSIMELADDFTELSGERASTAALMGVKGADPDAPPHRKDNPAVIAMMRGHGDLTDFGRSKEPTDGR